MSDLHYFVADWVKPSAEKLDVDVCIYGATSAGVIAGVEALKRGKSVVVLQPGKFAGGLTSGGLGWTDHGRKHVIGGLSREFYRRTGKYYGKDEEFLFEPSVATKVYDDLIRESGLKIHFAQYLEAVQKVGKQIAEIRLTSGLRVAARVFIDATYEGDLLAKAGVTYTVGREGNSVYNETLNGIQMKPMHQFSHRVDPYMKEGDASSGLLPGIVNEDLSLRQGQGDKRVQAYNFRVCMTDDPALKIDWAKPRNFDANLYVLAGRWMRGEKDNYNDQLRGDSTLPAKFDIFPNLTKGGHHKTDTNNHGPVSSDFIGANYAWPDGSYETREQIFQAHVNYQQGLYWYLANSPDVPERYRKAYSRWGLPSDEFKATGNWSHQLYVREARRLVGAAVITEHTCRGVERAEDSVGMGSYGMDSHNCSRFVTIDAEGARVLNEGDVQVPAAAYPIPYRAITPRPADCTNLLVPVCLSSSHIAYGSARMEPVFMVLGQSAAIAACQAIDAGLTVQEVPYPKLREALLGAGQILMV